MAGLINSNSRNILKKLLYYRAPCAQIKCISTSDKKKDGAVATNAEALPKDIPDFTKPYSQNWVSYGWSHTDEKEDLNAAHSIFFFGITIVLVFGTLFFGYFPDFRARDWSHREAFLELRRREQQGLPLIDMNYLPPDQIVLPSDEELGDREIII